MLTIIDKRCELNVFLALIYSHLFLNRALNGPFTKWYFIWSTKWSPLFKKAHHRSRLRYPINHFKIWQCCIRCRCPSDEEKKIHKNTIFIAYLTWFHLDYIIYMYLLTKYTRERRTKELKIYFFVCLENACNSFIILLFWTYTCREKL